MCEACGPTVPYIYSPEEKARHEQNLSELRKRLERRRSELDAAANPRVYGTPRQKVGVWFADLFRTFCFAFGWKCPNAF